MRGLPPRPLVVAVIGAMALACGDAARGEAQQPVRRISDQQAGTMKIRIEIEGTFATGTLDDTEVARDFASLLPLTMTLEDYNSTEKIADLPRKLSTKGAPPGSDPDVGDIAYYAPWGNLALFYRDFGYSAGLVKLGSVDAGVETLRQPGPLTAKIELLESE
jgi:hypothetical protein